MRAVGQDRRTEVTRCIVGGGPAGMMLGLLARAGVDVTVLEEHGDLLRDLRGDAIHPSTQRLLDDLGMAEAFLRLPHQEAERLGVTTDDGTCVLADFAALPGRFTFLTFMPQWDLLADQAQGHPLQLRRSAPAARGGRPTRPGAPLVTVAVRRLRCCPTAGAGRP